MPTSAPLIELENADVVSYTGAIVLHEVSWKIEAGDFWVVGGGYGSGKTDLLSTAAGLQRPENGRVLLFGNDIAQLSDPELTRVRKRIGLVFKHGGRMFANFSVLENVALAVRYHENLGAFEAAKKVESILDTTGLTQVATRIATTLGPNLRHRVALARALALQPEVLLLDDPLSGLDLSAQRWLIDFLHKISGDQAANPIAVVVATNNFDPWAAHGTRFGILKDKRWLAFSRREELNNAMLENTAPEV
jgi:phospholipid/cholesterol/gamma-HCH transport system ATP-binding protein